MNYTNLFKIALKALANNKKREYLTMLGIIIVVGYVITINAQCQGTQKSIHAEHGVQYHHGTPRR